MGESSNRRKREPVDRTGSQAGQRPPMGARPIALVPRKRIAWIFVIQASHELIARHLGHNGGRRDRSAPRVSMNDRALGETHTWNGEPINQNKIRWNPQAREGEAHRRVGGLQDIDLIDGGGTHQAYPDRNRLSLDGLIKPPALRGGQLLAICQVGKGRTFGKDHRRGHHRSSPWTSAGLINPRHSRVRIAKGLIKP